MYPQRVGNCTQRRTINLLKITIGLISVATTTTEYDKRSEIISAQGPYPTKQQNLLQFG